ncbi:MAG: hypothetical protein CL526_10245 [Aequorivita sp.]|nr:hypothetical protein [Aequorivita sp.]
MITKIFFKVKNLKFFFAIGLLVSMLSCKNENVKPLKITGLWKLESMKVRDTTLNTWSDYRDGMDGYLLYDSNGHVALHLYDKSYENSGIEFPNFTDTISLKALKYITKSYYYMGEYSVSKDDSIVSHYKLSHSNPSEFGLTAERKFYFLGDTLIMLPVEQKNARLRLKWTKLN